MATSRLTTKELAEIGILAALAVGMGYAFIFIPNLEMVSATVFIAGYLLGMWRGMIVGAVAETVYSAFNPMGSGLGLPHLMAAQVLGMAVFGLVGGIIGTKSERFSITPVTVVLFGVAGFVCTIFFDLLTSLAWPVAAGFSGNQIIATLAIGVFFYSIHVLSNTFIFIFVVPAVLKAVKRSGRFM